MRVKAGPSLLAALLLTGLSWSNPARAAVRVYVGVAPPAPIVETVPVAPGPNYVWIGGFHRWDGHAYVWEPGHYAVRPHRHSRWVAGHWTHNRRGHYWIEGRWR